MPGKVESANEQGRPKEDSPSKRTRVPRRINVEDIFTPTAFSQTIDRNIRIKR